MPGFSRRKALDWVILSGAAGMRGIDGVRIAAIEVPTGVGKSLGHILLCKAMRADRKLELDRCGCQGGIRTRPRTGRDR